MAESGMMKKKSMGGMKKAQAGLKDAPEGTKGKGLKKLPTEVRNKMGFKKNGGKKGKMKDRRK